MRLLTITTTLMGTVRAVDPDGARFEIECRSGDRFTVMVGRATAFGVMRNLDGLDLDRTLDPVDATGSRDTPSWELKKYVWADMLVVVEGVYYEGKTFAAKVVHILYLSTPTSALPVDVATTVHVKDLHGDRRRPLFEHPRWWTWHAGVLADQWLDSLFGDKRGYAIEDFVAGYRTKLNVIGLPTDDDLQECAVLSRLIYGLASAYMITGQERYLLAARAGVRFQRESFRISSTDGDKCMWAHARRRRRYGAELIVPSSYGEDEGSMPIYEQIYALSGLAMYYRVTQDPEVLCDIARTMRMFDDYYLDRAEGGYYSHIDPLTLRPDRNLREDNNLKKNWNSIGDHIPAYLVNVILALDPLPDHGREDMRQLLEQSQRMLHDLTLLILDKFPDPDPSIPYVNERFNRDWSPDHHHGWQQNRAVIGHNFKIAWNLTRIANYYRSSAERVRLAGGPEERRASGEAMAARCLAMAERLGRSMTEIGLDQLRGGCFDAVEREPATGMRVEFTWGTTKDFWQQEQAILAHLILYGATQDPFYHRAARETQAFWNLFFLDREHRGIYFRVNESGLPITQGEYGLRGGHSDASGYHTFELSYLAHVYNRSHVGDTETERTLCLYFKPDPRSGLGSINVAPDFLPPGQLEVSKVFTEDVERKVEDRSSFQISDPGRVTAVQLHRAR
ncbi:AGE family epimerase/isomerase [Sorangium sp. So ce381]|uniref:AGE family epimerase/isomerase n=1 Tax=Sorangium sp. So ce381 TaxID=3133307 RepID=UPI003F5B223B